MKAGSEVLMAAFVDADRAERVAHARKLHAFAVVMHSGVVSEAGYSNSVRAYQELTGASRSESRNAVARAEILFPAPTVSGELLPCRLMATREGFLTGQIPVETVQILVEMVQKLPSTVDDETWTIVEARLAVDAEVISPQRFRQHCRPIFDALAPDGDEPVDDLGSEESKNRLRLRWDRHGDTRRLRFDGDVDQITGEKLLAAITPLAKPHPKNEDTGEVDPRSIEQRNADGFRELLDRTLNNGCLPEVGGEPITLHVTMTIQDLINRNGVAVLDSLDTISAADARMLACDAHIIPVVLGSKGEPLDVGARERAANRYLRRALRHRDKGCAHPHCHIAAPYCHVHHIIHWADGGPTILDNCVLLCPFHHRLIHHSDWTVGIPETGTNPVFTQPAYLGGKTWQYKPQTPLRI